MNKQLLFWGFVAFALGFCFYMLRGIMLPFVLAFVLAYILNPLVVRLTRWKFSRTWATACVIFMLVVAIITMFLLLFPVLENQVSAFIERIPQYIALLREKLTPLFTELAQKLEIEQIDQIKENLATQTSDVIRSMANSFVSVLKNSGTLFEIASLIIITPVVAFYLLADWEKMTQTITNLVPRRDIPIYKEQIQKIDKTLSAYVRGQAVVCLFLGLFYGFGLTAIDLDLGFAVGFVAGIFSFIPYVGSLTGFALSLLLAWTQGGALSLWIGILLVFGIGQFIEGYVLTPKLIGDNVGLHPVWVIFSLFAGGYLFGFIGILLAVPLAAVLGVLVRSLTDFYHKTSFYKKAK